MKTHTKNYYFFISLLFNNLARFFTEINFDSADEGYINESRPQKHSKHLKICARRNTDFISFQGGNLAHFFTETSFDAVNDGYINKNRATKTLKTSKSTYPRKH